MSGAIITDASLADMVSDILAAPSTLRLYTDTSLPEEPTAGDFTEPDRGGYAAKPMRFASWDLSQAPEMSTYPQQTFAFTGPAGMIYGYYITRNDGRLRWYQPFLDENGDPAPQRIVNNGDEVRVTPQFCFYAGDDADADDASSGGETQ